MKKEEILAKSRAEKKDEGVEFALSKGRTYGIIGMTFMYLALLVFNWIYDQDCSTLFAMYWTYLSFELFGRYTVTKQKALFVGALLSLIAGLGFAAAYVIGIVR